MVDMLKLTQVYTYAMMKKNIAQCSLTSYLIYSYQIPSIVEETVINI